jgi:Fe-S cluster assembly protein SufD
VSATITATPLATIRPGPGVPPKWLAEAREEAFEWLGRRGFPTPKHEDWRYLRLEGILGTPFVAARSGEDPGLSADALAELVPDLGGPRLVFVNGHLVPALSSSSTVPDLLALAGVAQTLASEPERLGSVFAAEREHADGFAALNIGLAEDGAYVHIEAGATITDPIHLVFCAVPGDDAIVASPQSVVVAEPGSRATIVESHVGIGRHGARAGQVVCTNAVTRVLLDQGAHVDHFTLQDAPDDAFHLGVLDVVQRAGSRFSSHVSALGASIARHDVQVRLEGEGAEADLSGLYQPTGTQHHDNPVLVEHAAPDCTSRQLYHGVLDDRSHGVFNGRIIVRPSATGTDATQSNRNLLLSDRAEIDTRPRLEILADDVRCVHGATVGQLDEEAVHYLRTRGIPEPTARGMLTEAFANGMLERIDHEGLRAWVQHRASERRPATAWARADEVRP